MNQDDATTIRKLFMMTLSRPPENQELTELVRQLNVAPASAKTIPEKTVMRRAALEDLFWAVLTSDEFLFNH